MSIASRTSKNLVPRAIDSLRQDTLPSMGSQAPPKQPRINAGSTEIGLATQSQHRPGPALANSFRSNKRKYSTDMARPRAGCGEMPAYSTEGGPDRHKACGSCPGHLLQPLNSPPSRLARESPSSANCELCDTGVLQEDAFCDLCEAGSPLQLSSCCATILDQDNTRAAPAPSTLCQPLLCCQPSSAPACSRCPSECQDPDCSEPPCEDCEDCEGCSIWGSICEECLDDCTSDCPECLDDCTSECSVLSCCPFPGSPCFVPKCRERVMEAYPSLSSLFVIEAQLAGVYEDPSYIFHRSGELVVENVDLGLETTGFSYPPVPQALTESSQQPAFGQQLNQPATWADSALVQPATEEPVEPAVGLEPAPEVPTTAMGVALEPVPHQCLITYDGTICSHVFPSAESLWQHMSVHRDTIRASNSLVCPWYDCANRLHGHRGRPLGTFNSLMTHMHAHSGHKSHKCDFPDCTYTALSRTQVQDHMRSGAHAADRAAAQPSAMTTPSEDYLCGVRITRPFRPGEAGEPAKISGTAHCWHPATDASNLAKHRKTHFLGINYCPYCMLARGGLAGPKTPKYTRSDHLKRHVTVKVTRGKKTGCPTVIRMSERKELKLEKNGVTGGEEGVPTCWKERSKELKEAVGQPQPDGYYEANHAFMMNMVHAAKAVVAEVMKERDAEARKRVKTQMDEMAAGGTPAYDENNATYLSTGQRDEV